MLSDDDSSESSSQHLDESDFSSEFVDQRFTDFISNLDQTENKKRQMPSSEPVDQRMTDFISNIDQHEKKKKRQNPISETASKIKSKEHKDDFKFSADPLESANAEDDRIYTQVACMPCFKSKLKCNDERPCSNCVKRNRADICVDRSHKTRGRPRKIKPLELTISQN
jgi:hypothetical protein